jgi:hypothetical protein
MKRPCHVETESHFKPPQTLGCGSKRSWFNKPVLSPDEIGVEGRLRRLLKQALGYLHGTSLETDELPGATGQKSTDGLRLWYTS